MPTGASLPACIALGCSQKSKARSGFHAEADTQQLARDFHEAFPHAFMEPRQPKPDRAKDEAIISRGFALMYKGGREEGNGEDSADFVKGRWQGVACRIRKFWPSLRGG